MPLHIQRITDATLEAQWHAALQEAGYQPVAEGTTLHLRGVGVAHGDQSVDLHIEVLAIDGHRILALHAPLRTPSANHATAALACLHANTHCHVATVIPVENNLADPDRRFTLLARFHLYADHLSSDELRVMLYLFIKELDEIDNELAQIMSSH